MLESAEGGEYFGRYSFIGTDPLLILKSDKDGAMLYNPSDNAVLIKEDNPYDVLQKFHSEYSSIDFGLPYSPGTVGYLSYDSVRHIEPTLNKKFTNVEGCGSFPEAYFMLSETILVFDHVKHKIYVVNNVMIDNTTNIESVYQNSKNKIKEMILLLSIPHSLFPINLSQSEISQNSESTNMSSNMSRDEWTNAINAAKEHIKAGDIFQVVLSQRFCIDRKNTDTFKIYRALRSINPSPYLYYLNFNDFQIVGSSPEILIKCSTDKIAEIRPIAGTRKRGATIAEKML